MAGPTKEFWAERFATQTWGWDRGAAHAQLQRWLAEGLITPSHAVAVPGCGRGHELLALGQAGIAAVGLDYTPAAVELARERIADLPGRVELADVLEWQPPAPLDRVYEQTCLCALHPDRWQAYAAQLHAWLKPGGLLLANFMQALRPGSTQGLVEGPPYHCDINAMRALFPESRWEWPAPPYAQTPHSQDWFELAVVLVRR